jgi:hypothetical protein
VYDYSWLAHRAQDIPGASYKLVSKSDLILLKSLTAFDEKVSTAPSKTLKKQSMQDLKRLVNSL